MQEFKDRLKELRDESELSMKELGLKIGVSDAAICKWENGVSEPKITYILRLANFFECSTDFLLGVTDDYHSAGYVEGLANQIAQSVLVKSATEKHDKEVFSADVVEVSNKSK